MVYKAIAVNNGGSSSRATGNCLLARVTLLLVQLCEIDRCILKQWEIKPIEPDYRVLPFVPMIMPMP